MKFVLPKSAKVWLILLIGFSPCLLAASDLKHRIGGNADYSDVRTDIESAIINKGFVIDFNGDISMMLENTSDVAAGSKPVYANAEFWQFCSSVITRKLVELDPQNVSYCPFVIYAYETLENPGEVVVGFRPIPSQGETEFIGIANDINNLLESIIKETL